MQNCGIYLITCTPPGGLPRYYVGQSVNVARRWMEHSYLLRGNRHSNLPMQAFHNKHGIERITFEVLEYCSPDNLNIFEQWWLDELVGFRRVLNVGVDAVSGMRGRRHSDESRQKLSAAHSGKKLSESHIAALSAARKGKPMSESGRLKRAGSQVGRVMSDAHKKKLSVARVAHKMSPEHCAAISASLMGAKHPMFGKHGKNHPLSKSVMAVSCATGAVLTFESTQDAVAAGFSGSSVSLAARGKLKTHKGYRWSYVTSQTIKSS